MVDYILKMEEVVDLEDLCRQVAVEVEGGLPYQAVAAAVVVL